MKSQIQFNDKDLNIHAKLPKYWPSLTLLFAIMGVSIFNINEPLFISGILAAFFLVATVRKKDLQLNIFDLAIILGWGGMIVNFFLSEEKISSLIFFRIYTLSVCCYFIIRVYVNRIDEIKAFLLGSCICIALACLVAMASFFLFKANIDALDFPYLYDFRYRYKPLGFHSNVWGSFLLIFMGIVVLTSIFYKRNRTVLVFLSCTLVLIIFELVISFSRGVYLSALSLIVGLTIYFLFSKLSRLQKLWICLIIYVPVFISGFMFKEDVRRTLRFTETISQQRSIEGRLKATKASVNSFRDSPIWGTGLGTYSMVINDERYEDDNVEYSSFAPNIFALILTEQGIIGIFLWSILLIILVSTLYKVRQYPLAHKISVFCAICFLSIALREATFTVFFEYAGFQLLIISILGIQTNISGKHLNSVVNSQKTTKCLFLIFLFVSLLIVIASVIFSQNEYHNRTALTLLEEKHDGTNAIDHVEKCSERTPYMINRGIVYLCAFMSEKDTTYLTKANLYLDKAMKKNKHDIMIKYYKSIVLEKQGDFASAIECMKELTTQFPNKSLYNLRSFILHYNVNQKEDAIPYMIKVLTLSPQIIESPFWQDLMTRDSLISKKIVWEIMKNIPTEQDSLNAIDPISLSKYGSLLLFAGEYERAQFIFQQVVSIMPNLAYPWLYLYAIDAQQKNGNGNTLLLKRFLYLNFNAQSSSFDMLSERQEILSLLKKRDFINNNYPLRFSNWYKSTTLRTEPTL